MLETSHVSQTLVKVKNCLNMLYMPHKTRKKKLTMPTQYSRAPWVSYCIIFGFKNYFVVNLLLTTYETEEILYFSRFMTGYVVTDVAQDTSQFVCRSGHG